MFIGLITDYGYKDPYVGVLKAVIKSINPAVEVVDVTHGVGKFNVLEAAVALMVSAPYFPRGSIFVTIVDPGVGSNRRALLIETRSYVLLGPDNGCLTILAERDGVKRVFDVSNTRFTLSRVSYTFHGRDVFAPVAAWISLGVPLDEVGFEINYGDVVKIDVPKTELEGSRIRTNVLYIDDFGNVMTTVEEQVFRSLGLNYGDKVELDCKTGVYECVYERSFSLVPTGRLVCYTNSWGFLEIAVNRGNASEKLGLKTGDVLIIRKRSG